MTICYSVRSQSYGRHNGRNVRFLRNLDIGHVPLTPSPMNLLARITGVKHWLADHVAPPGGAPGQARRPPRVVTAAGR
jgi:hypothetical protein